MLQSARKIYRPSPRCGVGTGKLRKMFQTVQDDQEPCIRCDERAPQQLSELALCTSSQGLIRLAGEDSNKQRWCIIPVDGGDDNLCYTPPQHMLYHSDPLRTAAAAKSDIEDSANVTQPQVYPKIPRSLRRGPVRRMHPSPSTYHDSRIGVDDCFLCSHIHFVYAR